MAPALTAAGISRYVVAVPDLLSLSGSLREGPFVLECPIHWQALKVGFQGTADPAIGSRAVGLQLAVLEPAVPDPATTYMGSLPNAACIQSCVG